MNRRAFIVALLGALAGCSERLPADGPSPGSPSTTGSPPNGETDSPKSTITYIQPQEEPATLTPWESPTATSTPTATATSSPPPTELSLGARLAAEEINEAREAIRETVDRYSAFGQGPSPTLLDVTAAKTQFRFADINGPISNANSLLFDARPKANDRQLVVIINLLDVVEFLRAAGTVQERLAATYRGLETARGAVEDEEVARIRNQADSMENELRQGRNRFVDLQSNTSEESMHESKAVSKQDYRRKIAQFAKEFSTATQLQPLLIKFAEGIERIKDARRLENQENFNQAGKAGGEARVIFEDIISELDSILSEDIAPSFSPITEKLRSLAKDKREIALGF